MNEPGKTGSGIPYWPELGWVDWPAGLPRPSRERVMHEAYLLIGLDYGSSAARHTVKLSREVYKPMLVCAATPALVGVCGCSASEASRVMGIHRFVRRGEHLAGLMSSPAAKLLGGQVVEALRVEQEREYRYRRLPGVEAAALGEWRSSGGAKPRAAGGQG